METIPTWQVVSLAGILGWILFSRLTNLTVRVRSFTQPFVTSQVENWISFVLRVQSLKHPFLDAFFSYLSCIVSVPFYTGFLPLLFWSGHCKLGRQMTLLMAFCNYTGNCIKDIVSAPRPLSPPVRRLVITEEEKENALEYGLPSSHTLNTICLSGYLLYYIINNFDSTNGFVFKLVVISLLVTLSLLIGIGRIYLGMHSLIDVLGAAVLGTMILVLWFTVHERLDSFITSGKNVTSFWASFAFLLLFAYPTPELPTPSFEFHVAFNGVALGVVSGINRTFSEFHNEYVPRLFGPHLGATMFFKRVMIGLPIIIAVKFVSKALAKGLLPLICNLMGVPIKSSSYVQPVKGATVSAVKSQGVGQLSGYLQKIFLSPPEECYDVDTGIRLLQYAGLSWSVVELVPLVFQYMRL
uniref:Phosphatidic acid phosphatase type 2/haloperoxidase domain-containing protein n=1 Tax=Picea sitchensis TaxID=3332 RepID=B8LS44_PICSI|nr:unknown [Picea sitchensis]